MCKLTMETTNYGFSSPRDLFEKLERDAQRLRLKEDPDNTFNFFLVAHSLYDWSKHYYGSDALTRLGFDLKTSTKSLPELANEWVDSRDLPPIRAEGSTAVHVLNVLKIVSAIANGSKHFHLRGISNISPAPEPRDWSEYFNLPVTTGLCITIGSDVYSVQQISNIVVEFYRGLLGLLDSEAQR